MIVPDVNVLMYAHVDGFAQHDVARNWWQGLLSSTETVGLAPVVVAGFVRLATSARVLEVPMTTEAVTRVVSGWWDRPGVDVLRSDQRHLAEAMALVDAAGSAGNLVTDALIAAHALLHDATVATNDADFARFPGVRTVNPVAPGR
ncbi:TA system VapC family ribonuclease toxin [Microbacterium sp.]|uniref:TA system VapC family ribonuclease toxin n=1 Tax=Microbacterium sp. TaxID=51671 RepID=UPI003A849DFE